MSGLNQWKWEMFIIISPDLSVTTTSCFERIQLHPKKHVEHLSRLREPHAPSQAAPKMEFPQVSSRGPIQKHSWPQGPVLVQWWRVCPGPRVTTLGEITYPPSNQRTKHPISQAANLATTDVSNQPMIAPEWEMSTTNHKQPANNASFHQVIPENIE